MVSDKIYNLKGKEVIIKTRGKEKNHITLILAITEGGILIIKKYLYFFKLMNGLMIQFLINGLNLYI